MATHSPAPEDIQLRYGSASVFERPDTRAKAVGQLATGDPLTVLGTEDQFYRVRLPEGTVGFVYAHNLVGAHLPLTTGEQHRADERAAAAAQPPGGWRGLLRRLERRAPGRRG
jgi:hypothetical protein